MDFGTPLFDRVDIAIAGGRNLVIEAKRESVGAIYVQSVAWNGVTVKSLTVDHAQLAKGGTLVFPS